MQRRDFLSTLGAAAAWTALSGRAALAQGKKAKVLYFTRSSGFEHSVVKRTGGKLAYSEKLLTEWGKEEGFDVDCTKDGRVFDQDLDKYDAIVFYTSGMLTNPKPDTYGNPPMTAAGKQRLLDAVTAGKGFVALHAATDSFRGGKTIDPYIAMLGGEFVIHGHQQKATVKVTSPKFPGVAPMGEASQFLEEWYTLKNFAPDLHVILLQETHGMTDPCYQRPPYPATWARMQEKGRVFYTSFGHREDILVNPKVKSLILGGLAWALRRADADVAANISEVAPGANTLAKLPPPKPKTPAKK